jgi:S-adenosylmethionine hydrolase
MVYFYWSIYNKRKIMKQYSQKIILIVAIIFISLIPKAQTGIVVMQTDFGVKDGAVAAMKGVAMQVDKKLQVFDLTHEIPAYNIWEAAFRLEQTAKYWPKGTVFVSVVDPGVGSERKSIVLQTRNGYFFVSPDNGTLTLIAEQMGIKAVREIDEKINRLPGSERSYTFHGRDVFAYTAARLATGKMIFEQVGKLLPAKVEVIKYQKPAIENRIVKGTITVLDVQYGNVWSNIDKSLIKKIGIKINDTVNVKIYNKDNLVYNSSMPYVNTFTGVPEGNNLSYLNSMLQFSVAVNMGNFAGQYKISSGPDWRIEISK